MFADLAGADAARTIDTDLCVIGAGAAGITIARAFIAQRTRVCLVESGGFDVEAAAQNLYAGLSVGAPVALEAGRLRLFGGTTNHWGGRCAEFSPAEFAARPWVAASGWPLSLESLAPYYARAHVVCGLGKPWLSTEETIKLLGLDADLLTDGDVTTQLWRFAPKTGDGPSLDFGTVYRDALDQAENVQVLLHANLVGFTTDVAGRHVERIDLRSLNGKTASVRARYFVLCTGGIENARLLLLPGEHTPAGVGNARGFVGRYLMQHLHIKTATIAVADRLSRLEDFYSDFVGPDGIRYDVGLIISEAAQRKARVLNASAVLEYEGDPKSGSTAAQDIWRKLRDGRWTDDLGTKVWRIIADLPAFESNAERWFLTRRHPRLPLLAASVMVEMEQLPDPDSRVTLGAERDALGLPRVVVDWRLSDVERETARQFMIVLGAYLGAHGLGRLHIEPAFEQPGNEWKAAVDDGYHYLGTTRMSADASQGVVDPDCRVHGVDNLFVAGSSVFPTGGHVNPTLTIVALALRLADHLRDALMAAL